MGFSSISKFNQEFWTAPHNDLTLASAKDGMTDFAFSHEICHRVAMFYSITRSGTLARLWSLNGHDQVMQLCARMGFKP